MSKIIRCAAFVMLLLVVAVTPAAAQGDGDARDSVSDAAAKLLDAGRVNEARILLVRALRATTDPTQQAEYRLRLGNALLYGGEYDDASRAYNAVLTRGSISPDSPLAREAHHGLALVDAFNGRSARAAMHYALALRGGTLRDTIEMLVMTNQNDSAQKALDRLSASSSDPRSVQFIQAYRGLSWMMAGHCTHALPAIAKAPEQNGPVTVAVRGRCAMKHGQRADALVFKEAVLQQQRNDPFSWATLIARDAARKIE